MDRATEADLHQSGARRHGRYALMLPAQASSEEGGWTDIVILNISATGCLIASDTALELDRSVDLRLAAGHEPFANAAVVWASDGLIGCQFERRLPIGELSSLKLRGLPAADPAGTPLDRNAIGRLGERIRNFRLESGLSAAAVAERLEVSRPTLWAWETGQSSPRRANAERIIGMLDGDPAQPGNSHMEDAAATDLESTIRTHKQALAQAIGLDERKIEIQISF